MPNAKLGLDAHVHRDCAVLLVLVSLGDCLLLQAVVDVGENFVALSHPRFVGAYLWRAPTIYDLERGLAKRCLEHRVECVLGPR